MNKQGPVSVELAKIPNDVKPHYEVKVDLDERSFLFPSGKSISQIVLSSDGRTICLDAVFPFNQSRTSSRLLMLTLEDTRELGRRLIEAVHDGAIAGSTRATPTNRAAA